MKGQVIDMATRNYTKDKRYGARLSNEAKEHMVDATSGSTFAQENLGKDPKITTHVWHVTRDKDGNRFTQIAEMNQKYGGKAFTTPKGGLGQGHIGDDVIEAAKNAGLSHGDDKDMWIVTQSKGMKPCFEYTKNADGKSARVTVGYAPSIDQVHPMSNAVKASIANNLGIRGEDKSVDLSKLPDAAKGIFKRVFEAEAPQAEAKAAEPKAVETEVEAAVPEVEAAAPEAPAKSEAMAALEADGKAHRLVAHEMPVTEKAAEKGAERGSITVLDIDAKEYVNGLSYAERCEIADAPAGIKLENPENEGEFFTQVSVKGEGFVPTTPAKGSFEKVAETWKETLDSSREARLQAKIDQAAAEAEGDDKGAEAEGPEME